MQDPAKKLLVALADRGVTRVGELAMSETELADAVADLSKLVDDDNHVIPVVRTWVFAGKITAVELTDSGRSLVPHARK
jgi:hypothetical protein